MAFLWIDTSQKVRQEYQFKPASKKVQQVEGATSFELDLLHREALVPGKDRKKRHEKLVAKEAYEQAENIVKKTEMVLFAEQIMTSPVLSLPHTCTIEEAITFVSNKRFRHVPIVNEDKVLLGIVSDRDLFKHFYQSQMSKDKSKKMIKDLLISRVLTATPDTPIREVAKILFDERIGAMPILDEKDKLVGLITRSDILRALINKAPLELWV